MLYVPQGGPPPHQPPMHPLNALRNRAIAAAQTEVILFGSQHLPAQTCHEELHHTLVLLAHLGFAVGFMISWSMLRNYYLTACTTIYANLQLVLVNMA